MALPMDKFHALFVLEILYVFAGRMRRFFSLAALELLAKPQTVMGMARRMDRCSAGLCPAAFH
jgi:hypothetical protein